MRRRVKEKKVKTLIDFYFNVAHVAFFLSLPCRFSFLSVFAHAGSSFVHSCAFSSVPVTCLYVYLQFAVLFYE